jgi:orotate phosphoribosyltransferase
VYGVYAEKEGDSFAIRRGYGRLITGKKVLVVDDVLTTGGSVTKVIEAVRSIDGIVVGLGVICNRGGVTAHDVAVPKLVSLAQIDLDSWRAEDCPLCAQNVPINIDVGKGREFLANANLSKMRKGGLACRPRPAWHD